MSPLESAILVVDDIPAYREYLTKVLTDLGYTNVISASDGESALREMNRFPVRLVISDYRMSPGDGVSLLKALREQPQWAKIPFLFMTAVRGDEVRHRAEEYGATWFVPKPLNFQLLKRCVAEAIS